MWYGLVGLKNGLFRQISPPKKSRQTPYGDPAKKKAPEGAFDAVLGRLKPRIEPVSKFSNVELSAC